MPKLAEKYDSRQYYADVYSNYPRVSEVRTLRDYNKPQYERPVRSVHLQANKKKVKRNTCNIKKQFMINYMMIINKLIELLN